MRKPGRAASPFAAALYGKLFHDPGNNYKMIKKKSIRAAVFLVVLYIGVYGVLSIFGRYEPYRWGIADKNGKMLSIPKGYEWAPYGFVSDLGWKVGMVYLFLPLWEIDRFTWHDADKYGTLNYPIYEQKED